MSKKAVLTPEVMPAATKTDMMTVFDLHAKQLRADFAEFDQKERDAAFIAMRIGLRLEYVKQQMPHGTFEPWRDSAVGQVRERQCQRFQQLVRNAIAAGDLQAPKLKALCEGGAKPVQREAEQLVMDFIGGRTQAELFAEYGIKVKDSKPAGGKRGPAKPVTRSIAEDILVNLRTACEEFLRMRSHLNHDQRDAAETRLRETLEEATGIAWRPDAEKERTGK